MQSFLYNTQTICEDTHMTFQIKKKHKKVQLCEDAIFYVSPIDDMNKLYTQRQRWQIGELEVFHMFYKNELRLTKISKKSEFKTILFDHTFAFPRMIWYFALFALALLNYSLKNVAIALLMIYALYVLNGLLFYINISMFLRGFKQDRRYYMRKVLYLLFYPLYNLLTFVIRFSGIINSITRQSSWKTFTFSEELKIAKDIILRDLHLKKKEEQEEQEATIADDNEQ
jgi:putative glycosyltransferase (exosortase G-associated)